MENKLNLQELQSYARQLARKLTREYFKEDFQTLNGRDILRFSQIDQINYFILKILFVKWKEEVAQMRKSKYFDFDSPDVDESIKQLANILSNHIAIKYDAFEPLLAEAIEETIYLALSPYHYFKIYYFSPEKTKVSLDELKEKAKYLKINANFFNHFIDKLESYRIPTFQTSDIIGYFQESYYRTNDTFDAFEPIIEKLQLLHPLELNKIVSDLKKKDDYFPTPLEVYENQKQESTNRQMLAETVINIPSVTKTTADHHNITPIKLSLNQRIMFLNELFKGDIEQMNHLLARLESAGNLENALHIISFNNWDKENEVTQEFLELLTNKYKR